MQVLSLGSGFDTTYFNVCLKYRRPARLTYYEVDLASNVERKAALIRRSPKCGTYLGKDLFHVILI